MRCTLSIRPCRMPFGALFLQISFSLTQLALDTSSNLLKATFRAQARFFPATRPAGLIDCALQFATGAFDEHFVLLVSSSNVRWFPGNRYGVRSCSRIERREAWRNSPERRVESVRSHETSELRGIWSSNVEHRELWTFLSPAKKIPQTARGDALDRH